MILINKEFLDIIEKYIFQVVTLFYSISSLVFRKNKQNKGEDEIELKLKVHRPDPPYTRLSLQANTRKEILLNETASLPVLLFVDSDRREGC